MTVENAHFGGKDVTELSTYLVTADGVIPLAHTLTDSAVLIELPCDGEVVFVQRDGMLPEVAVEYRYDETNEKFFAGVYVKSGVLNSANLGFAFDSELLAYVGAAANDGFTLNASCTDGQVIANFTGSADASRSAVHVGDIEFTLAGEYDKTVAYLAGLVSEDAEGIAQSGFYLGTDGDGLETAVNMGVPEEYEYPYGYIGANIEIERAESDFPLSTSPMKLALYYEDGTLADGFPVTVDETQEFIVQVPNGEYTAVITKNGYLPKIIEQVPVSGGDVTDFGKITMIPGDIVNSADDDSGDGIVDIDDFVRILRAFSDETSVTVKSILDIDEDGFNTVADIALVKTNFGKTAEQTKEIYGMPKPGYFNNIYTRLIKDKKLTIGYMGGSITDGTVGGTESVCWRNQTTQWFENNFPGATITAIKASLGGTDTYLASFRMDKVLLEKGTPDLVFIEYASNDFHEGNNFRSSARQLESIFLKLRRANPNVNIIVIFSFRNFGYGNPYVTQAVRGMWTMADYYGVMVLPLGYEAYEKYKDTWYVKDSLGTVLPESFTNDGIHLSEFGHNYYTDRICGVIGDEILGKVPGRTVETEFVPQPMPEKFHNNTLENSYMVLEMEDYLTENTTFIPNTGNFSWATGSFPNSYIGSYDHDSGKGDIFEFKFTGTEVGIVYAMMNDNAYIRYRVDGGTWYRPTLKISGGNGSNPKTYRLFQGLDEGEHTVTIEVLGTKPSDSSGYNFRIGALLINPEPSAYSEELNSPSLLRPDGTYEDVSVLADNDPNKTEWDSYGIVED